ncbi:hypothetical protein R1flu_005609 [Riccia fluitans]|uniref:Uncharacterized protein n=1 Tax=Riccia fluitans TaxID=41844 RepID=A0ABD1YTN0_9MARC
MAMSSDNPDRHVQEELATVGSYYGIVDRGAVLPIPAPIGSQFCLAEKSEFKIVTSGECCGNGLFQDIDFQGDALFGFRNSGFWSQQQILHDDYGRTLATLKQSTHRRRLKWKVYRGKKPHNADDLLFTMGYPKVKRKKSLDIWLAGKEEPDFSLDAVYSKEHDFQIVHRGSEMVLAEVSTLSEMVLAEAKEKLHFFQPDEIIVKTYAGVDRAFIAAVFVMKRILISQQQAAARSAARSRGAAGAYGGASWRSGGGILYI